MHLEPRIEEIEAPIERRDDCSDVADDYRVSLKTCDVVFASITVCLGLLSTFLAFYERESWTLVALILAFPAINVSWSLLSSRLGLGSTPMALVRLIACVPITTATYVAGTGVLARLWIPAEILIVGNGILLGVGTRDLKPGIASTLTVSIGLLLGAWASGDPDLPLALTHCVGLLVTGLIVSIVSSLLGRSLETSRTRRAEADAQRKRAQSALEELAATQRKLVEAARGAGMAEIAAGVLHNVGNVLTSANVSASIVRESFSSLPRLDRAVRLLKQQEDLAAFWDSPKGRLFPNYLEQLSSDIDGAISRTGDEISALQANIEHIRRIVSAQQSHARASHQIEVLSVGLLFEEALRLEGLIYSDGQIEIRSEVDQNLCIESDRNKLVQVLVNLVRNARQAVLHNGQSSRPSVTLSAERCEDRVRLSVVDNGRGIDSETMPRLFRHGFTTRSTGNGFGLHMSALTVQELGGRIWAESEGEGCGATFVLELPVEFGSARADGESEKESS